MSHPIVFLHGWGQSARIWHRQTDYFEDVMDVQAINLPGHGGEGILPVEQWLDAILHGLPDKPVILVGCSLGGMLAMQLASMHQERIAGLVLISTTPCFRIRHDWMDGCDDAVFARFVSDAHTHPKQTMRRFFSLMLLDDQVPRKISRQMAENAVDLMHPPTARTLQDGLKLLDTLDLRPTLKQLDLPCLVMHGQADRVISIAAGEYLARQLPRADSVWFGHCGHAPFLTQAEHLNSQLEIWCKKII